MALPSSVMIAGRSKEAGGVAVDMNMFLDSVIEGAGRLAGLAGISEAASLPAWAVSRLMGTFPALMSVYHEAIDQSILMVEAAAIKAAIGMKLTNTRKVVKTDENGRKSSTSALRYEMFDRRYTPGTNCMKSRQGHRRCQAGRPDQRLRTGGGPMKRMNGTHAVNDDEWYTPRKTADRVADWLARSDGGNLAPDTSILCPADLLPDGSESQIPAALRQRGFTDVRVTRDLPLDNMFCDYRFDANGGTGEVIVQPAIQPVAPQTLVSNRSLLCAAEYLWTDGR